MATLKSKMGSTHRESETREKDVARLQGDIQYMKTQLSKIDKEKDNLLVSIPGVFSKHKVISCGYF